MISIIAEFLKSIPDEWRLFFQILAPFIALLVAYLLGKLMKWWIMHNPLKASYLIPRRDYREALFEGAGVEEQTRDSLSVGVGNYRVMHLIKAKREIDIGPIVLRLKGPEKNKPRPDGVANPYIVDDAPRYGSQPEYPEHTEYRNWNGEIYPLPDKWPRHLLSGDDWYIGNKIETFGDWDGEIILTLPIHGWKTIQKGFRLCVVEGELKDDIPFLEGNRRTDGKYKEIKAREESRQKTISPNT